ncbi:MAG: class II fructose-bisphosphate aldolase [Patescibacteria group bacterium]|nr:class II fructose-bisphosphate aldolase [Patescibacteria group bacterium]
MLVNPVSLYKKARKHGFAIGAFNTSNAEITKAIIKTAERLGSPVIIETSENEMAHVGSEVMVAEITAIAKNTKIPVALHLDHGKSFESVREAIRAGYSSVHIDGSTLAFEENFKLTKAVVDLAHNNKVAVEGEVGHIEGNSSEHKLPFEIKKENLTDPGDAAFFVKKTKVDILAISIGNIHGLYETTPMLDFDRLEEISKSVKLPFSLHGGSGIPKNQIQKAIAFGITKINVNTEIRVAFKRGLLHEFDLRPDEVVPYKYLPAGSAAVEKVVESKIKIFGSAGQA